MMSNSGLKKYKGFEVEFGENGDITINDEGFRVEVNPQDSDREPARIILITEEQYYNQNVIEELCSADTCLIIPSEVDANPPCDDTEEVSEEEYLDVFGVKLDVIEQQEGFGYVVDMRGVEFLISSRILDRKKIRRDFEGVDIAFLPLRDSDEISKLIKMAVALKPNYFVPTIYSEDVVESDVRVLTSELSERNIPLLD